MDDEWDEKLARSGDESRSLLWRYQSNGLEAMIYLAPDEGPPKPLLELGAVMRDPGVENAGAKVPYVLSPRAKEALRRNPELTGYTGDRR